MGKHKKQSTKGDSVARQREQALALYHNARYGEALPLLEKLLKAMPEDREINLHLGQIYYGQMLFEPAIERFEYLFSQMPNDTFIRKFLFGAIRDANKTARMLELATLFLEQALSETEVVLAFLAFATVCDWEKMAELKDRCIRALLNGEADSLLLPGFCLDALGMNSVDQQTRFALSCQTGVMKHSIYPNLPAPAPFSKPKGRLKIGYLSGDFRNHAVGYFCYPLIANHDRSRFEVFCYSGTRHPDNITAIFQQHTEHFVDVSLLSDKQRAERIREDKIDLLIDLGGHTSSTLINAMLFRPAPVQITYLGFASTTAINTIDYRITDHLAEGAKAAEFYTEELLYLPKCFVCFGMRPSCPRSQVSPVKTNGYITFGSFNNKRKLNPEVVALWSKILKQVEGSKLALKTTWTIDVATNVAQAFVDQGIAAERLLLSTPTKEYDQHVALYNGIDIALDTFPYTGTTTTCEALWMGLPVVTLVGESHASRASYSILKNVGYEETIAFSEDEYVEKAVMLAKNPEALSVLRPALQMLFEHSPVARGVEFTTSMEALYIDACQRKGLDLSGLHQQDDHADTTTDSTFDFLPGQPQSRALMVAHALSDGVKAVATGYLRLQEAPQWMVVLIPYSSTQDEIAHYFEQMNSDSRRFCAIKFEKGASQKLYRSLVSVCHVYHREASSRSRIEKSTYKMARRNHLSVVEHDIKDSCGMMLFDRLSPDLWRMLRSYYAESRSNKPRGLIIVIPWGEDRDKISGYLQNMHQFETSPDRNVQIMAGGVEDDNTVFLGNALSKCSSLHVPKATSTPMQTLAIELAEQKGMKLQWHDEKPAYMPEPLPAVKNFQVTVVVLTYNRVTLLKRALASILNQTYDNYKILIVDDASSDATESYCTQLMLKNKKIDYRRNAHNLGIDKNVRYAYSLITTELIVECADDDFLMDTNAIEKMVNAMQQRPDLGLVLGKCSLGDISGEQIRGTLPNIYTCNSLVDPQQILLDSISGNNIFGGGLLVRKSAWKRMAQYASKHWRETAYTDVLVDEGDYRGYLLAVMCVPAAYVHISTVYYSVGSDSFSTDQLGGGWGMEIRLRAVSFLDDMYLRHFGVCTSEDRRVQAMSTIFETQLKSIQKEQNQEKMEFYKTTFDYFQSIIQCLKCHSMDGGLKTSKPRRN